MNRVLIVDDEIFVRKGLRSLISWKQFGYEVCWEADNGEQALEIIQEHKPDLVVTDIRMPEIDGLELIKRARELEQPVCPFIIVSGYNDFKYAQTAVRYQVFDFVLKPIDQEEFEAILFDLNKVINSQKKERLKQVEIELQDGFYELIHGKMDHLKIEEWLSLAKLSPNNFLYYVLIEINNDCHYNQMKMECLKKAIKDTLLEVLNVERTMPFHEQKNNMLGMLISSADLEKGNMNAFIHKLQKEISSQFEWDFTIVVGEKIANILELPHSFQTADEARAYKYTFDHQPLLYDELKRKRFKFDDFDLQLFRIFIERMEENHVHQLSDGIDDMFLSFKTLEFSPKAIKMMINRLIYGIIQIIKRMNGDEKEISSFTAMMRWEEHNLTVKKLKQVFSQFVFESTDYIQTLRQSNMKGDIYRIKTYIGENYRENISLKSIAQTFYMNPVYMGQLFKKTFGVYFKDYLLQLRVSEAKKLLRQTDLRVYEIAKEVGFASTDYFVTQFEKVMKVTPTEYRQQLLNHGTGNRHVK
ncbi:response regulator transcription factor [Alkalihalobacillus pseudalcaliphilus]|uniref:response regulator transcription factor n=1 Tax=Alkalihalobacillus pseudalcaliphilus TaxID=79884 RepID=UPI00064D8496|nr:response regulator [Alkalihalobacillus pseudalcaliphilus]KMK75561.1 hypothetical protein AB990_09715 [Alkalihalobacillus pseudalcaliphilus]